MNNSASASLKGWVYMNAEGKFLRVYRTYGGFGGPNVARVWGSLEDAMVLKSDVVSQGLRQEMGHVTPNEKMQLVSIAEAVVAVIPASIEYKITLVPKEA